MEQNIKSTYFPLIENGYTITNKNQETYCKTKEELIENIKKVTEKRVNTIKIHGMYILGKPEQ